MQLEGDDGAAVRQLATVLATDSEALLSGAAGRKWLALTLVAGGATLRRAVLGGLLPLLPAMSDSSALADAVADALVRALRMIQYSCSAVLE